MTRETMDGAASSASRRDSRLRQLVLVARSLEPLAGQIRRVLDLGEGYHDPHIIEFGLENVVFPVGDTFLEIVAPVRDDTAAGRYLDRFGAGGYMVIVQVPEMQAARRRVEELGIRTVWKADHEEISGTHLHPADTGGAILSLDEARPPGSWRWAGPDWPGQVRTTRVRGLAGGVLHSATAHELGERWAAILGRALVAEGRGEGQGWRIDCGNDGDGCLRFENGDLVPSLRRRDEGLAEIVLDATDPEAVLRAAQEGGLELAGNGFRLGGVTFRLAGADRPPEAAASDEA